MTGSADVALYAVRRAVKSNDEVVEVEKRLLQRIQCESLSVDAVLKYRMTNVVGRIVKLKKKQKICRQGVYRRIAI